MSASPEDRSSLLASPSEPQIPDGCIHSKFTRGCPSCTYRWLKAKGFVKASRIFGHYSGLNRRRV